MASCLDQLKAHTVVVADTGDFDGGFLINKFRSRMSPFKLKCLISEFITIKHLLNTLRLFQPLLSISLKMQQPILASSSLLFPCPNIVKLCRSVLNMDSNKHRKLHFVYSFDVSFLSGVGRWLHLTPKLCHNQYYLYIIIIYAE